MSDADDCRLVNGLVGEGNRFIIGRGLIVGITERGIVLGRLVDAVLDAIALLGALCIVPRVKVAAKDSR